MSVSVIKPAEPAKKLEQASEAAKVAPISSDLFRGVRVSLDVRLGQAAMTVDEMMALKAGSVVVLQSSLADHVELYLNDMLVARGEVVAVGDKFGVRIVDIAPQAS